MSGNNASLSPIVSAMIASPQLPNVTCAWIQEMIVTALKMGRENITVADLKLFNRALRELRYAARIFAPYAAYKKVVVFGSARTPPGTTTR